MPNLAEQGPGSTYGSRRRIGIMSTGRWIAMGTFQHLAGTPERSESPVVAAPTIRAFRVRRAGLRALLGLQIARAGTDESVRAREAVLDPAHRCAVMRDECGHA